MGMLYNLDKVISRRRLIMVSGQPNQKRRAKLRHTRNQAKLLCSMGRHIANFCCQCFVNNCSVADRFLVGPNNYGRYNWLDFLFNVV